MASRKFLITASCTAIRKLSGLAVPSCCCGSSQRAAMLVCQASTKRPVGAVSAVAARWRKGAANAPAAAPRKTTRRVRKELSIGCAALLKASTEYSRHGSRAGAPPSLSQDALPGILSLGSTGNSPTRRRVCTDGTIRINRAPCVPASRRTFADAPENGKMAGIGPRSPQLQGPRAVIRSDSAFSQLATLIQRSG